MTDETLAAATQALKDSRPDDAEQLLRAAIADGHPDARARLIAVLHSSGRTAEVEELGRQSIAVGDITTQMVYGRILADRGRFDEAESILLPLADTDHRQPVGAYLAVLDRAGRGERAEQWLREQTTAGYPTATRYLAAKLLEEGRTDEAIRLLTSLAGNGDAEASASLARMARFSAGVLARERSRDDEAASWFERAADAKLTPATVELGYLHREAGRLDEAETAFARAADLDDVTALLALANVRRSQDDHAGAEPPLRRAAEIGDPTAWYNLGVLLYQTNRRPEALAWFRRAADAGDADAALRAGSMLFELDQLNEARPYLEKAAEAGDSQTIAVLLSLLAEQHDLPAGARWLLRLRELERTDNEGY